MKVLTDCFLHCQIPPRGASHSTQTQHGTTYYASSQYHEQYHFLYGLSGSKICIHTQCDHHRFNCDLCLHLPGCNPAVYPCLLYFRPQDSLHPESHGTDRHQQSGLSLPVPKNDDEFTQIIKSFNRMCDDLQRNVEKAYLYEIAQRKAELYAMQTSINPHFLYNALEQIRVQILKSNSAAASHMLLLLSKMYRNQTRRNLYITIAEECSQSENLINFYMYAM